MNNSRFLLFLDISFILILMLGMTLSFIAAKDERKDYIIYMGSLPEGQYSPASNHLSILRGVIKESSVEDFLIRSYTRSFNGFAAKLTDEEAKKLASMEGVVSIFPNIKYKLHTTRSWDFLGLNATIKHKRTVESNVVIGVIDSGIWPESQSFSDEGFGPPPKKWRGDCRGGKNFTCNNKLIGARFYQSPPILEATARDEEGHGTHCASVAAGNQVNDVSFFGLARGTAKGGVPSARIAVYKVCWFSTGCAAVDIIAAFDDAIADGVDVLSVSLGPPNTLLLFDDPMGIGAYHAMEKGIVTVTSAGNDGSLGALAVTNVAPWSLSVAASTTDRRFINKVVLGNGKALQGFSVNTFTPQEKLLPMVYGYNASTTDCNFLYEARACQEDCLESRLVKGKIVVCDESEGSSRAHAAGAAGSVSLNDLYDNVSFVTSFPAVSLNVPKYLSLMSYLNSTKNPVARILTTETTKDANSPAVAQFSSLGPSFIVSDILKPDITAPGVDIIAAFSPLSSPAGVSDDKRRVNYNIVSGTSMACPHVAAVAAYVKTFHPDWSPSAIQSAIMTTALRIGQSRNRMGEIASGSGHINPVQAIDPGLVYEALQEDYIKLMCSLGFSSQNIREITGQKYSCPDSELVLPRNLNYPSITAQVEPQKVFTVTFHRTVKNVGVANSIYKAKVYPNPKLKVEVVPKVLSFKAIKETRSFNVTVSGGPLSSQSFRSTTLTWSDGRYVVRSPIVLHSYSNFTAVVDDPGF